MEPQGTRPATIYDVAEAAGVSPSTVSRTFSRPGRVSSATADKVRQVAELLGYRTQQVNAPATAGRSRIIGFSLSDITNPFYFDLIRGGEAAASRLGYSLLLLDAQESGLVERETTQRALPLIDGLVVASSRVSDTELRTLAKQTPVVVLNRAVQGVPSILPDNARGVRRAVEHLAGLGHVDITYVAGPEESWADGARWRALREGAHELSVSAHRLGPNSPTLDGGRRAAHDVVARKATAVLTYNDLTAFGLVAELRRLGVQVPADVSVVGFDNAFGCDLMTPGLTTVAAPLEKLGELAVQNVAGLAAGARWRGTDALVVPVSLLVRASTAPPAS